MQEPVRDDETNAVRYGEMTFLERMALVKRRSHEKAPEIVAQEMMRISAETNPLTKLRRLIGDFVSRVISRS
jgi:hypothetical protein